MQTSSAEIRQLRSVFDLFDTSRTGRVSATLLRTTLLSAAQNHPEVAGDPKQYYQVLVELDKLGGQEITFEEFSNVFLAGPTTIATGQAISKQEAFRLFKLLDVENRGKIGYTELKSLMEELGEMISPEELQEMIYRADTNGDGLIDPDEFYAVVSCRHNFALNS